MLPKHVLSILLKKAVFALSESQILFGIVPPTKNGGCDENVCDGFGIFDAHLVAACGQREQWPHGSLGAGASATEGCVSTVLRQQPAADRLCDVLPGAPGRVPAVRPPRWPHA